MSVYIPGKLWESERINQILSPQNQIAIMQQVEAALAEAEADLEIIPRAAAEEIRAKADYSYFDLEKYNEQIVVTGGHNVVAFLRAWKPQVEKAAGEFIHFGATSQDITNTTEAIQALQIHAHVTAELREIRDILAGLAEQYKETPMAGRTHGQHAIPITFGLKIAVWLMEVGRHLTRLGQIRERIDYGSFHGAAGNLSSLKKQGVGVGYLMMEKLGLRYEPVNIHVAPDSDTEFMALLTMISTTFGKIATTLYQMSSTEYGEIEEPWQEGNIGSSTMPQKRNPPGIETMGALANICQTNLLSAYKLMMPQHERDHRTGLAKGMTLRNIAGCTAKILAYAKIILGGLVVYPECMRENIELTGGLLMSESLMMTIAEKIGRFSAHEKVYGLSMKSFLEKKNFRDLVVGDEELLQHFTAEELERCLEPEAYLGCSGDMVEYALKASRRGN